MEVLDARTARKRYNSITNRLGGNHRPIRHWGPFYWAPRRLTWLIGALFMIGSFCFAAGTVIAVTKTDGPAGIVFFVGSIFFTSAGYSQYLEVVNSGGRRGIGKIRALAFQPQRIGWWACSIQLVGTLFFNVSTFDAMLKGLDAVHEDRLVWAPDALGSICFLVASYFAYAEVCGRWWRWHVSSISWWIASANLVGSIAFGISAIGSYVIHDTGGLVNGVWSNAGTFIGAVMFFVGAYMLWPEAVRDERDAPAKAQPAAGAVAAGAASSD